MSMETEILSEVEALKAKFADTRSLYREVCVLLFFRHGITPTANKLYQYVRKGSMNVPTEELGKFWDDLRHKARVDIEHPDLPDEVKAIAAEAIAGLWRHASQSAREELAGVRLELQADMEQARQAQAVAEQSREQAKRALEQLSHQIEQREGAIRAVEAGLEAERRAHAGAQGRVAELQTQLEQSRIQQQRQQEAFSADLAKARDRNAPKVAIVNHPDVRRMLLLQKSHAEGMRALALFAASLLDEVELKGGHLNPEAAEPSALNDLLLPMVKGYCSEKVYELLSLSLQTYGGSGYLADYPIEQYIRDQKIDTLYEGTTHIQALDLLMRKVAKDGGQTLGALVSRIARTLETEEGGEALAAERALLAEALADVQTALQTLLGRLSESVYHLGLQANRMLFALTELVLGWLLVRHAALALQKLPGASGAEADFYQGKVASARFYCREVLPNLTLAAQFNWWKDSEVVRDFRPRAFFPVQEPDSFVEAVYGGENYFVSAFARVQPNRFHRVQERLPELRFDLLPLALPDALKVRSSHSPERRRPSNFSRLRMWIGFFSLRH